MSEVHAKALAALDAGLIIRLEFDYWDNLVYRVKLFDPVTIETRAEGEGALPMDALAAAYDALYGDKEPKYVVTEKPKCDLCGRYSDSLIRHVWTQGDKIHRKTVCADGCSSEEDKP